MFLSGGQLTNKWSYVSVPPTYTHCVKMDNLGYTEFIINIKLSIKMEVLYNYPKLQSLSRAIFV
jgi:hypothetical protein